MTGIFWCFIQSIQQYTTQHKAMSGGRLQFCSSIYVHRLLSLAIICFVNFLFGCKGELQNLKNLIYKDACTADFWCSIVLWRYTSELDLSRRNQIGFPPVFVVNRSPGQCNQASGQCNQASSMAEVWPVPSISVYTSIDRYLDQQHSGSGRIMQ